MTTFLKALLFALLLTIGVRSQATTYYVAPAPAGNDANAGTQASPFATISHAYSILSASGDDIQVAFGTYNEALAFGAKSFTLAGVANGSGQFPVLTIATGPNDQTLIALNNCINSTIRNIQMNVVQPIVRYGLTADNCRNLVLEDLTINVIGNNPRVFDPVQRYDGIRIRNGNDINFPPVAIRGVTITPTVTNDINTTFYFDRGIVLQSVQATIERSTTRACSLMSARDILLQFSGGGITQIHNTNFSGGGIDVTLPDTTGLVQIDSNRFNPAPGRPTALVTDLVFIKQNAHRAPITISNNLFQFSRVGIRAGGATNTTVRGNTFTPQDTAIGATCIEVNTYWDFGTPISLPFFPNSISIYDNTFNGPTARGSIGILFKNERKGQASPLPDYDQIAIGGGGLNANRFSQKLDRFVRLANQRTKTFRNNLDMSGNSFQISGIYQTPAAMSQTDLLKLEDRFDHAIDDDSVGLIRVKPNELYVTHSSFYLPLVTQASIQRAVDSSKAGDIVNIRDSIYALPINIDKDITFAPSGTATVIGDLTMATPVGRNQLRISKSMSSSGNLTLANGRLRLQASNFRLLNPTPTSPPAGSDSSYVMTDGPGRLVLTNVGNEIRNFPIGTDSVFRPVQISNQGAVDTVALRIKHHVLKFATSGIDVDTVVDYTWFFSEGTPGGGSYTFRPQWFAQDERPEFYRDRIYLQRYEQNRWQFLTGPAPRFLPITGTIPGPFQATASNLNQSFAFDTPLRLFAPKEIPDTIYYVDGVGGVDDYPNLSGRTAQSAWKTIQYAVTTASRRNINGSYVAPSGFIHIHVRDTATVYDGSVAIPTDKGRLVIRGGYLGSDAQPKIANTRSAAPVFTVSADTVFLRKLDISLGLSGSRTGISGQTTYDHLTIDSCLVRNIAGAPLGTGIDLANTTLPRLITITANRLFGDQPNGPLLAQGISTGNVYGTIGGANTDINQISAQNAINAVAISGGTLSIAGNTISATESGIRVNSGNGSASVVNNSASGNPAMRLGIQAYGFTDSRTSLRVDSNIVTSDTCLHLVNNHDATVNGNTLTANALAVHINSSFAGIPPAAPVLGTVTMVGNRLIPTNANTALYLGNEAKAQINPAFGTITIGTSGQPNSFATGFTNFIAMESAVGKEFDQDIDARNNIYGVGGGPISPGGMTLDQLFTLENKIIHKIDFATLGLARVKDNELYVTPQSFIVPRTSTPAIGRAVPPSTDGDIVYILDGTYPDTATVDKSLTFSSKGNATVEKALVMNGSGKLLTIINDFTLDGELALTEGRIKLTTNNLILNASCPPPTGGSPTSYVWTSGTGGLRQNQIGPGAKADSVFFPIGLDDTYNPIHLACTNRVSDFKIRLLPDVFSNGLVGSVVPDSVVQASWVISEGADSCNLRLTPQWNASQEKQKFDRTRVGIESYTGGKWAPQPIKSLSVRGSDPYSATRIMPRDRYNETAVRVISIAPLPNAVFIPSLFTPNDDNINDLLLAYSNNIQTISLKIYNRYGNIVYQTSDVTDALTKGWDGTTSGQKCNSDTYVWNITGTYKDGTSIDVQGKRTGYVILSR